MSVKGCFTDFHIDFGGTSVWYHVFRGGKVGEPCCLMLVFTSLCLLWRGGVAFLYFSFFSSFFWGGELVSDQSISASFVNVHGVC